MNIDILLMILLVLLVLWTVMTTRVLHAVIGLAMTSVVISLLMFKLSSPLAGVFELSVCAGLISVIFITTISFTQRVDSSRLQVRQRERLSKFWLLPFLMLAVTWIMLQIKMPMDFLLRKPDPMQNVNVILWNYRHMDILGQIIVLMVGIFSVVLFFKGDEK